MASLWTLQLYSQGRVFTRVLEFRTEINVSTKWDIHKNLTRKLVLRAISDSDDGIGKKGIQDDDDVLISNQDKPIALKIKWQETITSLPPLTFLRKNQSGTSFAFGICAAATLLIILLRSYVSRKSRQSHPGSVADLVRRGQFPIEI